MSNIDFDETLVQYLDKDERISVPDARKAMKQACTQVLDEAAEKAPDKAQNLFAEQASVNGRLITPKLVESEMKQSILQIKEGL